MLCDKKLAKHRKTGNEQKWFEYFEDYLMLVLYHFPGDQFSVGQGIFHNFSQAFASSNLLCKVEKPTIVQDRFPTFLLGMSNSILYCLLTMSRVLDKTTEEQQQWLWRPKKQTWFLCFIWGNYEDFSLFFERFYPEVNMFACEAFGIYDCQKYHQFSML